MSVKKSLESNPRIVVKVKMNDTINILKQLYFSIQELL